MYPNLKVLYLRLLKIPGDKKKKDIFFSCCKAHKGISVAVTLKTTFILSHDTALSGSLFFGFSSYKTAYFSKMDQKSSGTRVTLVMILSHFAFAHIKSTPVVKTHSMSLFLKKPQQL